MVGYHLFSQSPRQETLPPVRSTAESDPHPPVATPAQNPPKNDPPPPVVLSAQTPEPAPAVIPVLAPEPAPIPSGAWTREQVAAAFESKFKDVDATTIPWSNVGMANNGARCFANTALQSLFHMPDFRNLIYLIIKLVPNAQNTYPIVWSVFEIMRHMQCNPTSSLPKSMIEKLLQLVDGAVGPRTPFFITGTHDAEAFMIALCDALSNDFSPVNKFEFFMDRISKSDTLLMESESTTLARLRISSGSWDPQNYSILQEYREKIFYIFSTLSIMKTIDGGSFEVSINAPHGIMLANGNSRSCQDGLNFYLLPKNLDSGNVCDDHSAPDGELITFSAPIPFVCFAFHVIRGMRDDAPLSDMRGVQIDPVIHLPAGSTVCPVAEQYRLGQIFCNTGGHWLIYARCDDGKWRRFDDASVAEISEKVMQNKIERWKTNGKVDGEIFMRIVYFPDVGTTH
jgi:hypothetical protein